MNEIRRLAILNRGEAAVRALTAVAELNRSAEQPHITTIVVHTDPDAQAWYVHESDEAIALGPATYVDSADGRRKSRYLDEADVIERLRRAGVDAVWVGWGLLSEQASFAERCEKAGITFIGPSSATIRLLGDKISAKRLAERCDVPVVPWSGGPIEDPAQAARRAAELGYPVVVKAASGGGGRGIRVVVEEADLADALAAARAEAELSFGDPTVFLERMVPAARHVEVQVVADRYGSVWALGVRDCSIQRRHQKVIEESSSTALTTVAETAIKDAAVRLAAAADYCGAGTVEFLVDPMTGGYWFLEVNARLQVEHPVTEETTGVDLVKLQLHVARGGKLEGGPPPVRGHAVEARLNAEDPELQFAPAPGRLVLFAPATGGGVRVDSGVRQGDSIAPEFDSMIAKIIAWGHDRAEALTRLQRALAQTTVVVAGGTTNRSFLLSLLQRQEVRTGRLDNHWLDRLTAHGEHLPPPDPVAVLQAAVEAYDQDQAAEQAAFHARAARGRPDAPAEVGHPCVLRYRGVRYPLRTYRTGPRTYRVENGSALADIEVERRNAYERRVTVAGQAHRVVAVSEGTTIRIEVDGVAHRVTRDDGGAVRCEWPAFVVSVRVRVGDRVAAGDPLVVLESMKMEATVTAPFAGEVCEVDAVPNVQVEAGAQLLRIRPASEASVQVPRDGVVKLTGLRTPLAAGTPPCERVYGALRGYLLGYDLDPPTLREMLTRQRRLCETTPPTDPGLLSCEDGLLDLFTDVGALYRPRTETEPDEEALAPGSTQEYLLSYLQWLDPERAGVPDRYRTRLSRALRRYGVPSLERTAELEAAVVWMFRSFRRAGELTGVVTRILERRLRHRGALAHLVDADMRGRLDRLAAAVQGRYPVVADLARDVRFQYLDAPLLAASAAQEYAEMAGHLDALRSPAGPAREEHIARLVGCAQPLRAMLLAHWRTTDDPAQRRGIVEVYTRRFYRIRELRDVQFVEVAGRLLCCCDYDLGNKRVHLVVTYAPLTDLPAVAGAVAEHLRSVDPDRKVVVDLETWSDAPTPSGAGLGGDELAARVRELVEGVGFGRRLWRLDLTLTSGEIDRPGALPVRHVTLRQQSSGAFVEDELYRDLHPMLAKRLDLWRLSNFRLRRLPSPEDVYLFHGVAHDNPADHRLFALAEVRDLTPASDSSGQVSYPQLELMGLQALAAMRAALTGFPERERPVANRIVLYVRPPWTVPAAAWPDLAHSLAPLAVGAGLQKAVLRVAIPRDGELCESVLHVEGLGRHGVTVRERPAGNEPIRPLTEYQQKVLTAQRFRAPYPYELLRLLAPPPGTLGRFPPGRFVEYDLAGDELAPVERRPGRNTANVVVGLVTNVTAQVPEGMTRVAVLGDPTRGLGNLAEPECRRIIAALDLAERMRVPLEWYALSSGARIAMDSGTENMDWIAAVLRRLVEYTQAGGEVNVVVTGVNVGAQPYWNAEATMLMHTRGILVMTPESAMVLTGKQALDFSGGVSAEDNLGIGGFDRVMGRNGQGQYWAPTIEDACAVLLRYYDHTYVVPGERYPRRAATSDPTDRDVRSSPMAPVPGSDLTTVGDVFSAEHNPDRKKPFDIRSVLRAVADADSEPLERWAHWHGAETGVVWDARIGGIPVCLLGLESHTVPRRGYVPADGPSSWTSGTLFPQSSRKIARAVNAASGNRPLVMLANLSGFDGSPESMRRWQLEYGAEIGRAVTNFRGPIVFVVVSRYHGGAFVVFSKRLNRRMEIAAVEGSYASVIGGAPAAATVFAREVKARTERDPRVHEIRDRLRAAGEDDVPALRSELAEVTAAVRSAKLGEVAEEFDRVHTIQRAREVGSVDRIIPADKLRPYVIDALVRGMAE